MFAFWVQEEDECTVLACQNFYRVQVCLHFFIRLSIKYLIHMECSKFTFRTLFVLTIVEDTI